jgi:hypothetical protein
MRKNANLWDDGIDRYRGMRGSYFLRIAVETTSSMAAQGAIVQPSSPGPEESQPAFFA